MKDLHCHLLYGIDDGCKTIDDSIKLLRKLVDNGTTEVVLTPHYVENSKYNCNNKKKEELFATLKNRVKKENIEVKLYLGNEVFYTNRFIELIKKKEIATINNSKYILFEFPLRNPTQKIGEVISSIIKNGYVPILAHPERYPMFQERPELAEEYLRMGVLLQGNYTSLFGKYGRKAKRVLKLLIKKGWISFLGSDAHHDIQNDKNQLERKLTRLNKDKEYIKSILETNFDKVIYNDDIAMIR